MLAFVGTIVYFYGFEAIAIPHFDLVPKLKIINFNKKMCVAAARKKNVSTWFKVSEK